MAIYILLYAEKLDGAPITKLVEKDSFEMEESEPENFFVLGQVRNIQNKGEFEISGVNKEAYVNENFLSEIYAEDRS